MRTVRGWGVAVVLLGAAILSACDGFFFDPAERDGAPVTLAFQMTDPATQPGLQDAFDRIDAADIVLRQAGAVLFQGTVSLATVPGGLVAEIEVDAGVAAGSAVLEVQLTAAGDPLFEGTTTVEFAPGLPVAATVPITLVDDPPVVEIVAPTPGTVGIEGVPLTLRGVALDKPDGDISDGIVWLVDGEPLGLTGASVEVSPSAGEVEITARITDSGGNSAGASVQVTILEGVEITTTALPDGRVDASYGALLTATGGDGSYAWSVVSGALPPGLSLAGDGLLSGIPAAGGTFEFTVQVASGGGTARRTLSVVVDEFDPPVIAVDGLPDAVLGLPYEVRLTATGGDGSYTWRLFDSLLPEGLELLPDGLLTGVPSGPTGTRSFVVEVESAGLTSRGELALTVVDALSVDPASPPDGEVDQPYDFRFTASGGDGDYEWSLGGGVLPPGLALDGDGRLSGTPTESGTFAFAVEVSSAGQTAAAEVAVEIVPGIAPSGLAWVLVNRDPGFVRVLNASTRESLGTVEVGANPVDIAITPEGELAVVVSSGSRSATLIDTRLRRAVETVSLGSREPSAVVVSPDGTRAYVTSLTTDDVAVIDLGSAEVVATIPVGDAPTDLAVAPDGNDLYVVNSGDGSVSVVDLIGLFEAEVIPGTPGDGYRHIALDPVDDFIAYVTAESYVWVIQVEDFFEIDRVPVSLGTPERIVASESSLVFVAASGSSPGVAVFDTVEGLFNIANIATPGVPRDLALAPDGGGFWVAGGISSPYLNIYGGSSLSFSLISSDGLPETPFRLALPPGG